MRALLGKVNERERQVLILSFGLFGQPALSDEEIGCRFTLGNERVRQIRKAAIRKLRERLEQIICLVLQLGG